MPLTPTNYLNSVIYKIEHINNPKLIYIGSTTNFIKRKYSHKKCCNDEKVKAYNIKLYQMMRDNGGFNEFKIMVIKEYPCNNKIELIIEEEKYRKEYQPTLNQNKAYRNEEEKTEIKHKADKKYRDNNKDKIKEYRENNKDKIKEDAEEYRENNKDKINKYKKEYDAINKDKIREYQKEYRELNKTK